MIYFCGDIHGSWKQLIQIANRDNPDAIVLLGDMECDRPIHEILGPDIWKKTWFIPGNHDSDNAISWANISMPEHAERNLHGRVVDIAGQRIGGLGGVFRGEIWHQDLNGGEPFFRDFKHFEKSKLLEKDSQKIIGKRLKHQSTIFPDVYQRLMKQRADMLITHEASSAHPYGFEAIDLLAFEMGVKGYFHGHHHDALDYSEWSRANGIKAFGVGLRGITDEHGTVILAGEIDSHRMHRNDGSR